jgi:hypothetical protein
VDRHLIPPAARVYFADPFQCHARHAFRSPE